MKANRQHVLLPALFSAGSFLILCLLALLTSPVKDIAFAVAFFVDLLILLFSLGYLVTLMQTGQVSRKSRGRIFIVSIFILLFIMFRSAGSLSWVDGLVLILIVAGLLFYSSHRS